MLLFGICLITLGSLAIGLHERFGLSGAEAGGIFSILPIGILAGSTVFGPACDRFGYRFPLVSACLLLFIGSQGLLLAGSLPSLRTSILLFGLGGGIINGATNALVSEISTGHRSADLSLLGVSFGIGALGMPLVLGLLSSVASPFHVVSGVGWLALVVGMAYLFTSFPGAKPAAAGTGSMKALLIDDLIWMIALFLFFQSSLEAIVNNWTTSFLEHRAVMSTTLGLYALSIHILGMVVMRAVTGGLLRGMSPAKLLWLSLGLIAVGMAMLQWGAAQVTVIAGLFLSGAGLAGGFPIMLGYAGERFPDLQGTAFSFVFTIALIGNILVNYLMGLIVDAYGVSRLPLVSYIEVFLMAVIFLVMRTKSTIK